MMRCTIGVLAYNEEHNIIPALHALLDQRLHTCEIAEIIVIASGCTDRTVERAQAMARAHPLITMDVQGERAGKAAAINRLIQLARCDVIVLVGADTLPDPTALELLVQPFADPSVGMTGARVVPLNGLRTFLGLTTQIMWRVHHRMALRWPKLGELVAFRKVVSALPVNTATDEVALEALISAQGYRLVYVPDAVVYNRGPQTLSDFLWQRRRIFAGHLHIATTCGYMAASLPPSHLIVLAAEAFKRYSFLLPLVAGAAFLESWARLLGALDFLLGQRHHIWRPAPSTKQLSPRSRPFMIVVLQCRAGSVRPARLIRALRDVPASQGELCWWSRRLSQVLFLVSADVTALTPLEEQVKTLAAGLSFHGASDSAAVLSYRIAHFMPSPLPSDAEGQPERALELAPAA